MKITREEKKNAKKKVKRNEEQKQEKKEKKKKAKTKKSFRTSSDVLCLLIKRFPTILKCLPVDIIQKRSYNSSKRVVRDQIVTRPVIRKWSLVEKPLADWETYLTARALGFELGGLPSRITRRFMNRKKNSGKTEKIYFFSICFSSSCLLPFLFSLLYFSYLSFSFSGCSCSTFVVFLFNFFSFFNFSQEKGDDNQN